MQASADRPRFRQDLVAEPIEDGGARFIDVLDPDSGTLFRFFEVEYSLACAMDGQRDVAGIVRWAEEELGVKPSAKEVTNVIMTLGDLGYLERGAAAAAAATAPAAAAAAPAAKAPTAAPASNRWDQPTHMGDKDDYLEKGVVHGGGRAATPAPEVELGKAGTRPSQPDTLPRAPELELGAPGVTAPAAARAAAKSDDIPLGKPGRSENVEVDLAADMPLNPAAVKEAVRQSQVMKSVDVPPELAAELEKPAAKPAAKAEAKVEAKPAKAEPKVEAKPAKTEPKPEPKPEPKVEAKPAKAEPKVEKKPVEAKPAPKPEPRPEARPRPESNVPTAPARAVSPVLIAALVLVFLGLGGFALWKFVINKKEPAQTTGAVTPPPTPTPEPPAPAPVETAKLATEAPVAEEVKPVAAGQVATIVANDTAVKEGDPIARLVGFKPVEAQLATIDKALAKAKDAAATAEKERDAAQTAGNKNGAASAEKKLTSAQKTITEQEAKLATAKAALDKFLIKAPTAGKVTAVAKANAKVSPTDVIATLTPEPTLVATFKSAGEVAVGSRVLLAIKGGDQKLSCTVAQAGGDGVKIGCPKDAAPEGTEVTYAGIDPNAPAPTDVPGAVPGGTPPAGSGAAPAGDPAGGAGSADAAKPEDKPEDAKPEEKKAEEKKAEKKTRPRPRPRPPVEKPAGGDKPAGSGEPTSGGDKPADPPPAPPPAPPAGSGTP